MTHVIWEHFRITLKKMFYELSCPQQDVTARLPPTSCSNWAAQR